MWGLSAAGLAAHCLPSASVARGLRDNGRSSAGAQQEAGFGSFPLGAGLDFPGFSS